MLQISIFAVVAVLLAVQLKSVKPEYGIYISFAAGVIIIFYGIKKLETVVDTITVIQSYIPLDTVYMGTLIKMIGITYLTEFASGICRDTGYQSVAGQIETFGKLSILAVSMPVVTSLLETVRNLLVST
ncbi:MAG: stage III sporulation protein AD [Lachnospiraceae bacterium]|nr:stage III sporulation protein AD [Lachnospiraceae bacterium]